MMRDGDSAELSTAYLNTLTTPPGYGDEGVYDFEVELPANSNIAYIVIALSNPLSENKKYYKYKEGVWDEFVTTEAEDSDRYYSAPPMTGADGEIICPPPAYSEEIWGPKEEKNKLQKGDQCVLLRIRDGGLNDADGIVNADGNVDDHGRVNGVIADPSAPGSADENPGRGSGSVNLSFLLMLMLAILLRVGTRRWYLHKQQ